MTEIKTKAKTEELGDEEIVELYWSRNEQAISETSKKYGPYLHTIAYNILHDRLDCEECVNDTYLGTWNRIPPTRPNVLRVFLAKIARNISIDRFRENHSAKRIPSELVVTLEEMDEFLADPSVPEEEYAIHEMIRILNDYLRTLSSRREFIFVCRYYYSDPIDKIANMLGIGRSTVYRELTDMRQALKEAFERGGWHHE